jgi:hypothetical protein
MDFKLHSLLTLAMHVGDHHTEVLCLWEKNTRYLGTGQSRSGRVKEEENL